MVEVVVMVMDESYEVTRAHAVDKQGHMLRDELSM